MNKQAIVTALQLRKLGACTGQRELFEKLFGTEVEITRDFADRFYHLFDWEWGHHLLESSSVVEEFVADCEKIVDDCGKNWRISCYCKKEQAHRFAEFYVLQETGVLLPPRPDAKWPTQSS